VADLPGQDPFLEVVGEDDAVRRVGEPADAEAIATEAEAVALAYRGRPRAAAGVAICGLLGIAVAIAIDLPQGLQVGRPGLAFTGTDAVLLLAVPGVARAAETAVKAIGSCCGLCPPGCC